MEKFVSIVVIVYFKKKLNKKIKIFEFIFHLGVTIELKLGIGDGKTFSCFVM